MYTTVTVSLSSQNDPVRQAHCPSCYKGGRSPEKASNLPNVTQFVSGTAGFGPESAFRSTTRPAFPALGRVAPDPRRAVVFFLECHFSQDRDGHISD